jgi:aminocarboxymuconate-semialdehyde decarboxylase
MEANVKKIDTHCHFYPKAYVDEIEIHNLFEVKTRPRIWKSVDERIADMDKYGIERQVLSLSAPFVNFDDDKLNLALTSIINGFTADLCRTHPDRFSAFISVPLRNLNHAMDELKRSIKNPGTVGVTVAAHIKGKVLTAPEFVPFFKEVDRLGLPVLIHPEYPLGIGNVEDYQDFYRSMGFLWETTMAVGRMALSGFFDLYPNISWILCHLGGALPFVYTSMDMCQKRNPAKEYMPSRPVSDYFRRLYVDTARLVTGPILNCAIDLYSDSHIMFGTDIPFAYDVTDLNVPRLETLGITEQLRQNICYTNAARLLKL